MIGALSHATEQGSLVLVSGTGEQYVMPYDSHAAFGEVVGQIQDSLTAINHDKDISQDNNFRMSVVDGRITVSQYAKKVGSGDGRNYNAPLTQSEIDDITYIVTTLANESLVKLKGKESSLKKVGDRVDHVHPFKFLYCIFSREELKVGIRNIQGRSWVGKSFMDGLTSSLKKENTAGNLMPFTQDFANTLNIDVNIILPSLQAGQYDKFVDILIKTIPRSGDSGRYDM